MSTGKWFIQKSRIEHLIAAGRLILAVFFLIALWIDPSEPPRYAHFTLVILACYLIYALVLGLYAWQKNHIRNRLLVVTHSIDLLVFSLLMYLTEGPGSPFFVFFIFLLVCATLRWQWRGTLWSALSALLVVILLSVYPHNFLHDHDFELNRLIIRIAYLTVVATMLGFLGAYEQSIRNVLTMLAEWPRTVSDELQTMTNEVLGHAATVLGVPRILLAWEAEEEPWLHLVLWTADGCQYSREHPEAYGALVAEQLADTSFFCRNAADPQSPVMHLSPSGMQRWQGAPLQQQLQERFAIGSVLVSKLKGDKIEGFFLALDKKLPTDDDMVLGGIVAHEVAVRFDNFFLLKQLKQAAVSDAQIRLARDLHDGLLQSLTGAALQLEIAQRLIETEPQAARRRIQEIQHLLASEQRDLRIQISELRPFSPERPPEDFGLADRLEKLAKRISLQWGTAIEIAIHAPVPRISRSMAREIYFVVNESLINAVRHAGASCVRAELSFDTVRVKISVIDDGKGFAFRGRFDLETLFAMKRGPVTLRERISALEGTLSIDSRETGVHLDITLPFTEHGG
jgi:signal transduction histidine kinase